MSSFAVYDDARTLIKAANLVPATNIHWSNEPFQEIQGANWLSIDAFSNNLDMLDIGGNKWIEEGSILVYCCAPFGSGTDSLRTLAKAVCNVFRNLPARNPYYLSASIGSGGLADQGDYFVMPVSISFRYED